MANTQLWIAVLIPTITVLVGIFVNALSVTRLENTMNSRFAAFESSMNSRLTAIESDLRRFFQILGEHNAEIEHLKKP